MGLTKRAQIIIRIRRVKGLARYVYLSQISFYRSCTPQKAEDIHQAIFVCVFLHSLCSFFAINFHLCIAVNLLIISLTSAFMHEVNDCISDPSNHKSRVSDA